MEDTQKQIMDVVLYGKSIGNALNDTINKSFDGRTVVLDKGELVSFSLCDYLGLSTDSRLKDAAAQACKDYGVYTAVSRTYMKLGLYREAEEIVSKVFGKPCLLVPRTTLAHMCALPTIVGKNDVLIMDQQVHATVQVGAQLASANGCKLDMLRHSRIDQLEEKIQKYSLTHDKVWYLADGVCSMFGDALPVKAVNDLLEKYPKFHLYVDDAHGMSWTGKNGSGYLLSKMKLHPRLVMITSLGKGFGSGGGAIICPTEEMRERIEILGIPLMFTSPVEPPTLAAIITSAQIHLGDEINVMQAQLKNRMTYLMNRAHDLGLPVLGKTLTPITFIACGKPDMTTSLSRKMMNHGFYVTPGVFPAVPFNNGGIRIMSTLHQTMDDIENMLVALKGEYEKALAERNIKTDEIKKFYKSMEFYDGTLVD